MSQELDFSVNLHANGEAFVRDLNRAEGETGKLKKAATETGAALRAMGGDADKAASSVSGVATAAKGNAAVHRANAKALRDEAAAARAHAKALRDEAAAARAHAKATSEVTKGKGALRAGFQQVGFNVNDMVVQYQMGTKVSTIFAQQSGQVFQALQLISGGMQGSTSIFGKFFGLLGGPWGIVLSLGISAIAAFSDELFGSATAANTVSDALDFQKQSTQALTAAINEQLAASRKAIASSYEQEAAAERLALANLKLAESALIVKQTRLDEVKNTNDGNVSQYNFGSSKASNTAYAQSEVSQTQSNINNLRMVLGQKQVPRAMREIEASMDGAKAAVLRFDKAAEILKERLTGTNALNQKVKIKASDRIDSVKFKAEMQKLSITREREEKAAQAAKSSDRSSASANRQFGREIDSAGAVSIAKKAGYQVNSSTRPTYIRQEVKGGASSQERLYNKWVAQGKPKDNPTAPPGSSAHEKSKALDIQYGKGISIASIRKTYADAGVKLTKVKKERGHFHIEFSTSGADKAENEAERIANAAKVLSDYGKRSAEQIQRMNEQFNQTPSAVNQVNAAIRDVNALMDELKDKQPPGFEQMIADALQLEPLIRQTLRQPIIDMISDQGRQINIGQALLENDQNRADEMGFTYDLMQKMGAQSEAQLATELARRGITGDQVRSLYDQLDVLRSQGRELDLVRAKQQANLALIGDMRSSLRDTVAGVLSGEGFGAIGGGISRMFQTYVGAKADQISETLFGDIFRKQEEKITGVGKVNDAGEKLAKEVDKAGTSLKSFAATIETIIKEIAPQSAAGKSGASGTGAISSTASAATAVASVLQESGNAVAGSLEDTANSIEKAGNEIVVTASRTADQVIKDTLKDLLKQVFGPELSGQIGDAISSVFKSVAVGTAVSGTLKSMGIKTSKLGGQIGAIGGKAVGTAIGGKAGGQIGEVVGAIYGSIVVGLFKKSKTGSASLGFSDGVFGASGVGGNNKGLQTQSKGLISEVSSSLSSMAEQLGGILTERARVSIGYDKKGRVVVDTTGAGRTKGNGVQNFGKDGEAAAQAFATLDALKDGAINGLSEKVAAALRSSSDLDRAIKEALKVDQIEQLLAGFGGASKKAFVDFERQAKERLRIAGKYGFDLVKLEQMNAQERNKLFETSVEKAVGGLKNLLEELTTGARAPGTLMDRRSALLVKKAELEKLAPTDADAAAKLADILDQLEKVSVEAFGTAGALYAGDRANITSTAEKIITQATSDLRAAQDEARKNAGTDAKTTDALIGTSNNLLGQINEGINEQANQSAQMIALLGRIGLQNSGSSYGNASNIAAASGFGGNFF